MKNDGKKMGRENLQLCSVAEEFGRSNVFKTMSLNDLLASLALILEFESVSEKLNSSQDEPAKRYLH